MKGRPGAARVLILAAVESVLVLAAIYAWFVTEDFIWLVVAGVVAAATMALSVATAARAGRRSPKPPSIVEGGRK